MNEEQINAVIAELNQRAKEPRDRAMEIREEIKRNTSVAEAWEEQAYGFETSAAILSSALVRSKEANS